MRRRALQAVILLLLASAAAAYEALSLLSPRAANIPRAGRLVACIAPPEHNGHSQESSEGEQQRPKASEAKRLRPEGEQQQAQTLGAGAEHHAGILLDALDNWLRSQTVESVLPRQ